MAQARTRLWFLPTSPRSPDKIRPELTILRGMADGKVWTRERQAEFFREIVERGVYASAGRLPMEPDQPGRERVHRAPRALGFVRAATDRVLEITSAGDALIQGHDPSDLFLHQLLKLQFPSPNHDTRDYRDLFQVKPFLEVLRLVRELGSISKFEMQAFGLTLTDYRDYAAVVEAISAYRQVRARVAPGRARRELEHRTLLDRMRAVYRDDLAREDISLRERGDAPVTPDEVLATKVRNAGDYADAAMRYFQRTGLFTITGLRRLRLLPERVPDVEEVLATVRPEPESYRGDDLEAFWAYLGDPGLPRLSLDRPDVVQSRFIALHNDVPPDVLTTTGPLPDPAQASVPELKLAYSRLLEQAEFHATATLRQDLARRDIVEELVTAFRDIISGGVIDRALLLEWNLWRVLAMLDDGEVRNNFKMDRFGNPVTFAPGMRADVECTYESFHLLTEVTVSRGARQHASEGEPVTRHVGLYQQRLGASGDGRPVYGLFVAERLDPTVVADFYGSFTTRMRVFGGGVKVIPLEISDVIALISATRSRLGEFAFADLHRFLERASVMVFESMDEVEWRERLRALAAAGL